MSKRTDGVSLTIPIGIGLLSGLMATGEGGLDLFQYTGMGKKRPTVWLAKPVIKG
ncbi:hypothetical protein N9Z38_02075 [Mariniblastus sp.]|nr:hypothetical protein [Mariniblastus sp.]